MAIRAPKMQKRWLVDLTHAERSDLAGDCRQGC
jgi:hypothetical protein